MLTVIPIVIYISQVIKIVYNKLNFYYKRFITKELYGVLNGMDPIYETD